MVQQISEDRLWSQIVGRAWSDEVVMNRLLSNPRAVLAEHGLVVPEGTEVQVVEGTEVQVVEDTDMVRRFIFPVSPSVELSEEELVGGAVAYCGACGRCGCRCGGCRCRCSG